MKVELNNKEYNYSPFSKPLRCNYCAWKSSPIPLCVKFCRIGYIFRTTRLASPIFHL